MLISGALECHHYSQSYDAVRTGKALKAINTTVVSINSANLSGNQWKVWLQTYHQSFFFFSLRNNMGTVHHLHGQQNSRFHPLLMNGPITNDSDIIVCHTHSGDLGHVWQIHQYASTNSFPTAGQDTLLVINHGEIKLTAALEFSFNTSLHYAKMLSNTLSSVHINAPVSQHPLH